ERGRHRVGRELAPAGAGARAGAALDLVQLARVDLTGVESADRLEDLLDRETTALVLAEGDGAAVQHDARQVEPRHRHHHRRDRLVAAGDADEAVEEMSADDQLDRVGDRVAADEGGRLLFGADGDAIGVADRYELDRRNTRY